MILAQWGQSTGPAPWHVHPCLHARACFDQRGGLTGHPLRGHEGVPAGSAGHGGHHVGGLSLRLEGWGWSVLSETDETQADHDRRDLQPAVPQLITACAAVLLGAWRISIAAAFAGKHCNAIGALRSSDLAA